MELADIKVKRNGEFVPILEPENPVQTDEATEQPETVEEPAKAEQEPLKSEDGVSTPTEEKAVIEQVVETPQIDKFPSEKFGGKFSSWEEVQAALEKPSFKDDFIRKVVEKYESEGTLKDFFEAYSTDWNKVSDLEVMRRDFFEKHPHLTDEQKAKLWNRKQRDYGVDPEQVSEEELEENLALLANDAYMVRKAKIEAQQKLLEPQKADQQIDVKKIRAVVESQPEVKSLREQKKVVFDIDGQPFNYSADDTETIIESLVDENVFRSMFITNGRVDIDKWSKSMLFSQNPQKMVKTLVDYGKTLARMEIEQELKNPKVTKQQAPAAITQSPDFLTALAEEFAKNGKSKR